MWVRSGWRVPAVIVCAVIAAAMLGLGLAATYRPVWYRPASVDRSRLRADKAALFNLQDEISAALNSGHEIHFQLHEEQVNRWIAAREEMWPGEVIDLGALQLPQVSLTDGGLRVGAIARKGDLRAVVGLTCRVSVTDVGVIVRCDAARLGALPVPRGWVSDLFARIPTAYRLASDPEQPGTVVLRNDWVWPNGKRRCRLRELRMSVGVADVVLEPLPADRR